MRSFAVTRGLSLGLVLKTLPYVGKRLLDEGVVEETEDNEEADDDQADHEAADAAISSTPVVSFVTLPVVDPVFRVSHESAHNACEGTHAAEGTEKEAAEVTEQRAGRMLFGRTHHGVNRADRRCRGDRRHVNERVVLRLGIVIWRKKESI